MSDLPLCTRGVVQNAMNGANHHTKVVQGAVTADKRCGTRVGPKIQTEAELIQFTYLFTKNGAIRQERVITRQSKTGE